MHSHTIRELKKLLITWVIVLFTAGIYVFAFLIIYDDIWFEPENWFITFEKYIFCVAILLIPLSLARMVAYYQKLYLD